MIKRLFTSQTGEGGSSGVSAEYMIDEINQIHQQFPLIDDADSSQHSALIDAVMGKSLVIEGPPGTGKSQTITNLIAAAILNGKKSCLSLRSLPLWKSLKHVWIKRVWEIFAWNYIVINLISEKC